MGRLFTLDDATKATIQIALDDIIGEFGKVCRVVSPPQWVACAACSEPYGIHGGPMPFSQGADCPMCHGTGGFHMEQASEEMTLKIEWEPARFWVPFPDAKIRAAHSFCQAKCFASQVPALQQCDHIVVQLPIEGLVRARFRMVGSPVSPGAIIQDRYWVSSWESVG